MTTRSQLLGIMSAVAVLSLLGCSAPVKPNPTATTSTPSPLVELRDRAVAAGYDCPSWKVDDGSTASCSGRDRFLWFSSTSDRDDTYSQMSEWVKNGMAEAVLFGPTWAINGQESKLRPIRDALGGELMVGDAKSTEVKAGRSCAGAGELKKSTVSFAGDKLVATFELKSEPPIDTAEDFGVFIMAANYDKGTGSYQAGVVWVNGRTQGPFIADLSGSVKQANYPPTGVQVRGRVITVSFDAAPFRKLGSGWQWRSAISLDTKDLDGCPGGVGDFLAYGD